MLQSGNWSFASSKSKKQAKTQLSDEELRRRIFANTAVLFPDSAGENSAFEIVYGTKPRDSTSAEQTPWQYAMIVRRNQAGTYTPLIKGQAWSTSAPWSMVLQGLFDTTATLIHNTIGQAPMPQLGILETLPRYEATMGQ